MKVKETWTCCICGVQTNDWPNNGKPLVNGEVCNKCNNLVFIARII